MSKLKQARENRGLSQSQLAAASGVSVRMIQHYEQGVRDLNKAQAINVVRLADALEVDVKDILDIDKAQHSEY